MAPVLDPIHLQQEPAVLPIAFVGVVRQSPENGKAHEGIRDQGKNNATDAQEHGNDRQSHADPEQSRV